MGSLRDYLFGKQGRLILAVGILGALLLFLSSVTGGVDKSSAAEVSSDAELFSDACSRVSGAGEVQVFIRYEEDAVAAVIIDAGSESPEVASRLRRLAADYFGIGINRVSVI